MAKLLSSSEKTTVEINPDGNALIFKSVATGHQVYWPLKDWPELDAMVKQRIGRDNNGKRKST